MPGAGAVSERLHTIIVRTLLILSALAGVGLTLTLGLIIWATVAILD